MAPVPSFHAADATTKQFPTTVRQRMAQNISDPGTVEGAAVLAVAKGLAQTPKLLMHGDSLIANFAGTSALLTSTFGAGNVANTAVGGIGSSGVAALQGGRPAMITVTGGVIPATGSVAVTSDAQIFYTNSTSATKTQAGFLAGVPGTLTGVKANGSYTYSFTRSTEGYKVPVPKPVPFRTGDQYRDHVMLLDGGRNNLTDDPATIVQQFREMLAWNRRNPNDHIILTIPAANGENAGTTNRTNIDAINAALRAAFPRNVVDWAAFLASQAALDLAGLTASGTDASDIANGITPQSLRNSGDLLHFNSTAYQILQPMLLREFAARGIVQYNDPVTPTSPIHTYGLTDASHRYVTDDVTASNGSTFTSWTDKIGSIALANASSSLVVAAGPGGVDKSIARPNTTTAANTQRLFNSTGIPTAKTVAVVYNNTTPADVKSVIASLASPGFVIQRAADGTFQTVVTSGIGSGAATDTDAEVAGWRVVFGWVDAANNLIGIDTSGAAKTGAWTPGTPTTTTFVVGGGETSAIDMATAEVIVWDRVLSDSDRATVRSALRSHYPVIA
ncbi:hypothetical protein DEJ21_14335 [Curtobacterium sp. MCSS17_006]|uniref:hypothetical protein n=1 Tax=Curtobacterium sp. MCSS17_006 TaxID=2175642 RepID=UPI000DA8B0F3|nr:hypothetical protein [Curtobacterium sp. MCSS17_006]PZE34024.1 hypothetical protein DEJ21_14335 [Curtobacterium sp. MCSS17_006]